MKTMAELILLALLDNQVRNNTISGQSARFQLFTHVLYLNGGHPTWGALDYVKLAAMALCSLSPHRALARVCSKLNLAWLAAMPRLRRIVHSSQALFS